MFSVGLVWGVLNVVLFRSNMGDISPIGTLILVQTSIAWDRRLISELYWRFMTYMTKSYKTVLMISLQQCHFFLIWYSTYILTVDNVGNCLGKLALKKQLWSNYGTLVNSSDTVVKYVLSENHKFSNTHNCYEASFIAIQAVEVWSTLSNIVYDKNKTGVFIPKTVPRWTPLTSMV